ncbi:TrkH family potassium uptake protein, partial [Halanaerobium sp.]|uniref:TrkH family potassium uptake protein n=1 Tax=Halanaerobium sp. TaxID=1895664 RepID=UPI000DE7B1D7
KSLLKSSRLNTITYYLSHLLFLLVPMLIIPLIISLLYNEGNQLYRAYYFAILFTLLAAFLLRALTQKNKIEINLTTAMLLCAFSWIVVSLFGSLPFIIGIEKTFIDALFESTAGFTSAGLTVFSGLNLLPKSIIFWRSLMQFLGGLGILTFFLLIASRAGGETWQFFSAEGHKFNVSRPVPNIFRTVKILWGIYILFILAQTVILKLLGLSFFDALTHSFTTISTGGFSHYDQSIGYFAASGFENYILIEYVIIFFMFLGGVNFLLHYRLFTGDYKGVINNGEFRTYSKIIIYSAVIISAAVIILKTADSSAEEIFRKSLFQITALLTTTGFSTENINSSFFPAAAKMFFLLLMLIGGSVGSTSGGIKVMRVKILGRLFKRDIKKIYYPTHAVLPVTIDKQILDKDEIFKLTGLFSFWLFLIAAGGIITALFSDLSSWEAYSTMFSAVGNIGPSFISVDKLAALSPIVKIVHIVGMIAGRLEIIPLIILLNPKAWKS